MKQQSSRRVLVIGGSRGIGAAIVRRFEHAGDQVTFSFNGSEAAAAKLASDTGATMARADSSDRDAVRELVRAAGPLDVLVVNAGVLESGDPTEIDPDAVDRLFAININSPYHAAVEAARTMPNGGRIIFIGSTNGDRMPMPGLAAYSASKSALQGMTRGLARDFGDRGITVNVVQPGPTDTDMNPADGPLNDLMHSFMAIKRHATADEVAGMVAYLAGPDAGIVTGGLHTIDGGMGA